MFKSQRSFDFVEKEITTTLELSEEEGRGIIKWLEGWLEGQPDFDGGKEEVRLSGE